MSSDPFRPRAKRAKLRFIVVVHGFDEHRKATRQEVKQAAALKGAYQGLIDVIQQWENSHGAITPGTRVAIYDTFDGGKILDLEYLGFGDTLI